MWRRLARPAALLVLGGVGIYLLLPSLLSVFGSWRSLEHLDWPFAILAVACEAASFVCLWKLDRIALRARAWFPVAAAQLSGNAEGRVLPGGGATRPESLSRCCAGQRGRVAVSPLTPELSAARAVGTSRTTRRRGRGCPG